MTRTSVKAGKSLSLIWVSHGTTECIAPASLVGCSLLSGARRLRFLETSPWPRLAKCLDGQGVRVRPQAADLVRDSWLPARPFIETIDVEGQLERAMVEHAEACNPDIVVICSKMHEVFGPSDIGRSAHRVLSSMKSSVLLLRSGLEPYLKPGPIIVPLNTPKRVMLAVQMLQRLDFPGSTEILFAAFQESSQGALGFAASGRERDPGRAETILWAKESAWAACLDRATTGLLAMGWNVDTVVRDQPPADGLLGLVEATSASLVVVGDRPTKFLSACEALSLDLLTSRLECSALVVR